MNRLHLHRTSTFTMSLLFAIGFSLLAVIPVSAQLAANQTKGFGNNQLVTFTYLQNFDCVDQPLLDLDFNGIKAQSDPNEMQTPICQPVTEPTEDPTGGSIKHTAHLYVFVRCFPWTMIKIRTMQCHARTVGGRESFAVRLWVRL